MGPMKRIIFAVLVISLLLILFFFQKASKPIDEIKIDLPVNLANYDLKYNIVDHIDNNGFLKGISPTKKYLCNNPGLPLIYEKINKLKNDPHCIHAVICYPDGGSALSFFDVVIDSYKNEYYILNGVISGSVFYADHIYLNDKDRIFCYGADLRKIKYSMGKEKSMNIYPFYLYDLEYDNNGGIKSVKIDLEFSKRLTELIERTQRMGYTDFRSVVKKNNKELRFTFAGRSSSLSKKDDGKRYSFDITY